MFKCLRVFVILEECLLEIQTSGFKIKTHSLHYKLFSRPFFEKIGFI